jgi:pyruvate,water dikinase
MSLSRGAKPAGGDLLQYRYRVLRRLLAANSEMLELMADLEADLAHLDPGERAIRQPVLRLLDGSLLLAENLNILTGDAHRALYAAHAEIEQAVRSALRAFPDPTALPLMLPLEEACIERIREVGGKAANLGRLRAAMPAAIPAGFVLTTAAYRLFLAENRLQEPIRKLFKNLSLITGRRLFKERTAAIRALIAASPVPGPVLEAFGAGVRLLGSDAPSLWAVRSSAVGEDGRMSFAGQFDSVLNVPASGLASAYREVIASRYNDHAVLYRLAGGFSEVDTPMAALVMPMLDARAAGVLYTRDPNDASADRMLIDAVAGLAEAMVRGGAMASSVLARRSRPGEFEARPRHDGTAGEQPIPSDFPLGESEVRELVELGLRLEAPSGRPLDVEWVVTHAGALMVVQCRPLRAIDRESQMGPTADAREPAAKGGMTVFPGRAVGPPHRAQTDEELMEAPDGAILIVRQAGPELAAVLPRVAGVVAEQGNPAGHAAALIREFAVPSLFGVPEAMERLGSCHALSLDATQRLVFEGSLWPEVRERVRSRIRHLPGRHLENPLHERVLALNLTNPLASTFRAGACRSVHDIVRYTHERAVAAMFDLGDDAGRQGSRRVCRLQSDVPLDLAVLDLSTALPQAAHERRVVGVEEIASPPFQALWRGMTRPGVSWAGRTQMGVGGFLSVVASSMSDPRAAVREIGGRNYLMVAPDYVNLNARLAYHFAMVDAFVSPVPENNFVNFRFRGGGAGHERRSLRARFLAEVLLRSGFGVDRRSDLVTAWLRRYPRERSEEGLTMLGALMACARQLDMLMRDEAAVRDFVERFLQGDYAAFA